MESEGPYSYSSVAGKIVEDAKDGSMAQAMITKALKDAHAEGRKSAEKEFKEKKAIKDALLCGTGFVREGKRVPPEDVYLSETEIKLKKAEKEFKELLGLANMLESLLVSRAFGGRFTGDDVSNGDREKFWLRSRIGLFSEWKHERGLR